MYMLFDFFLFNFLVVIVLQNVLKLGGWVVMAIFELAAEMMWITSQFFMFMCCARTPIFTGNGGNVFWSAELLYFAVLGETTFSVRQNLNTNTLIFI